MANVVVASPTQFITRAEAARLAERCARMLVEQFGAQRAIPFGSVTGDSPWHSRSDIDLAVEGLAPKVFFTAWVALDPLLPPGLEVDLHDLKELPPELRARILGEIKMPKENIPALKFEIEAELKSLQRVVDKVIEYLPRTGESDEPEQVMIAKYLHDYYNGVEHIFERIAVRLDGGLPSGDFWHTQLLEGMAAPVEGVRPAVIDSKLHKQLYEFLKFRHRIRHVYSYDLEWPKVKERAVELEEVMQQLRKALETFIQELDEKGKAPEDEL